MTFWKIYTAILSVLIIEISGLPLLRTSDLERNGHLVHFHRDAASGRHFRHIHHRPTVKRSHATYRDTFFQKLGSPVNPSAVYEVPRNRHFNDAHAGRFSIQLQSLVESPSSENNSTSDMKGDNNDSGDNNKNENTNDGVHSVQNRDAPSPPSDSPLHHESLPHGLHFLNRQSRQRGIRGVENSFLDQTKSQTLDLSRLLGDAIVSTTPSSLSNSDVATGGSLDLGFLLGDLGTSSDTVNHNTHAHDHVLGQEHHGHSHNHGGHGHGHNSIHDKSINARSNRLEHSFMGMFGQHSSQPAHMGRQFQDVITLPTTKSVPSRFIYQNSTQYVKTITKRGVADSDTVSRFPKTFIDNILNIRITRTSPPPLRAKLTTPPTRYRGYLTTPRTVETQIERLSGIDLRHVRQNNRHIIGNNIPFTNRRTTAAPTIVAPSQNELVHLKGIHVMFSNGKQETSGQLPTVHLTAAVSENINHLLKVSSGGSKDSPGSNKSGNISEITDRITGTAIIRDGHLYLVVYPFGNNKSLELHYNKTKQRVPLPRNKPITLPGSTRHSPKPTVSSPVSKKTSVKPTIETKSSSSTKDDLLGSVKPTGESPLSSTLQLDVSTLLGLDSLPTAHDHHVANSTGSAMKDHHHHAHDHPHKHHHGTSSPSITGLKLSEVNDSTLKTLLEPVQRFMSPWENLNFSKVIPYTAGGNKSKNSPNGGNEEDTEVDVVTFIAKATDPFNRMQDIITSLVNRTLNVTNTPSAGNDTETKFNFELKLEAGKSQSVTMTSTANPNNSEEKTLDTNLLTTAFSKTKVDSTAEHVTKPTVSTTENSFSKGSSRENTTPFGTLNDDYNRMKIRANVKGVEFKASIRDPHSKTVSVTQNKQNVVEKNNKRVTDLEANETLLHAAEHIGPSTVNSKTEGFSGPKTTLSYIPNYTKASFLKPDSYQISTPAQNVFPNNRKTDNQKFSNTPGRHRILGSNLQPLIQRTSPNRLRQGLNRGQSEQIISLADILNDIRRIQLHNMQRFNIQNNNFDTMILSETQQKPVMRRPIVMEGPLIKETGNRRYSDFPTSWNRLSEKQRQQRQQQMSTNLQQRQNKNLRQRPTKQLRPTRQRQQKLTTVTQATPSVTLRRFDREAILDNAFKAMLVLSVDDVLPEQTDLHGAIVLSHRYEASSSKKK